MWPMILRNCLPDQKGSLKFPKGGSSHQPRNVTRIVCFNLPNPLEKNIITNRYIKKNCLVLEYVIVQVHSCFLIVLHGNSKLFIKGVENSPRKLA